MCIDTIIFEIISSTSTTTSTPTKEPHDSQTTTEPETVCDVDPLGLFPIQGDGSWSCRSFHKKSGEMKSCKQKCPQRKKPIGKIGKVICNGKTQKWTAKGFKVVDSNNSYDNLITGSLSVSKRRSGV